MNTIVRSIPKEPELPTFTPAMIQALHSLCFVPIDWFQEPLDALMIFGTGHWYGEIGDYIGYLIPQLQFRHRLMIITGGRPQFEDSAKIEVSESELIFDYLSTHYPDLIQGFTIHLESNSNSTKENIVNSLPHLTHLQPGDRLWYVMKAFASGRTLYGLRRFVPHLAISNYSANYDHRADPDTWMNNPQIQSKIRWEYLRIVEYSRIGNLDVSTVQDLLDTIAQELK